MSENLPRGAGLVLVPALLGTILGAPSTATGQAPVAQAEHYRMAAGDVLEILVTGEPELSVTAPLGLKIARDGRIGFPHLGHIEVADLTCDEAAELIATGLMEAQVLVRPQVLVRVLEFRSQRINVIGAVRTPGNFPHRRGMTVRDALAVAGDVLSSRISAHPSRAQYLISESYDLRFALWVDYRLGLRVFLPEPGEIFRLNPQMGRAEARPEYHFLISLSGNIMAQILVRNKEDLPGIQAFYDLDCIG